MTTYSEMVYYVLESVKLISDDSTYTEEHVLFLLDKYRSYLLKQKYEKDPGKQIPVSNYQTLCLGFEETPAIEELPCEGIYLRSTKKLPNIQMIGIPKINTGDKFRTTVIYVSPERFEYAGSTKFNRMFIYGTIGPDGYVYVKSTNPQFRYLTNLQVSAVFEDPKQAAELSCDGNTCDIMSMPFPLEEDLIPAVIDSCKNELIGAIQKPKDPNNNASDDLGNISQFILNNMKDRYAKEYQG